jgi:hypothetical protein
LWLSSGFAAALAATLSTSGIAALGTPATAFAWRFIPGWSVWLANVLLWRIGSRLSDRRRSRLSLRSAVLVAPSAPVAALAATLGSSLI